MAKKAVPPSFGQKLGVTSKRRTLDCVVEIAHEVALDFSGRPELLAPLLTIIGAVIGAFDLKPFGIQFRRSPVRGAHA
jgi:hypothetical protein